MCTAAGTNGGATVAGGSIMASFYIMENQVLRDPRTGKSFLKLGLGIRLTNPQGAQKAIAAARDKNGRIAFPDILKSFASVHGTYSQLPGKKYGF